MGQEIGKPKGPGRRPKTEAYAEAKRHAEAAQHRADGKSYRQIADAMGINVHTAHKYVQLAIAAVPVEAVTEMRAIEGQRLDEDEARLQKLRDAKHWVVSHGRVVCDPDTDEPLVDHESEVRITLALLRVRERRARLFALDMPATQHHEVKVEHTTAADAELERLAQQLGARALEEGGVARGGER